MPLNVPLPKAPNLLSTCFALLFTPIKTLLQSVDVLPQLSFFSTIIQYRRAGGLFFAAKDVYLQKKDVRKHIHHLPLVPVALWLPAQRQPLCLPGMWARMEPGRGTSPRTRSHKQSIGCQRQ